MTNYGKLTAALIAAWFVFALSASISHLFVNTAQRVGLSVALAAGVPIIAFFAWLAASDNFRKFALSLSPRTLTSLQTFRIVGIIFVILEARQLLPARFALSAGYGDMFIGATAWLAATRLAKPASRALFIVWQALGILDLVSAVALGVTAGIFLTSGPTMYLMTVLPLSLIPTFFVPLFMMFHVISIAQASQWREPSRDLNGSGTKALGSAAA
jgi:hypothetical protein